MKPAYLICSIVLAAFSVFAAAQDQLTGRVDNLSKQARFTAQVEGNYDKADSISELAIKLAESASGSRQLYYKSIMAYLVRNGPLIPTEVDSVYLEKALDLLQRGLTKQEKIDLRFALVPCLLEVKRIDVAERIADNATTSALVSENLIESVKALISDARIKLYTKGPIESYTVLLQAERKLAKISEGESQLLSVLVDDIKANIHLAMNGYRSAVAVKDSQIKYIATYDQFDSLDLYDAILDRCAIFYVEKCDKYVSNFNRSIEMDMKSAIKFADRHDNDRLYHRARSIWLSWLIENNQLSTITKEYSDRTISMLESETDSVEISKLCLQKGLILIDQAKTSEGLACMKHAIEVSIRNDDNLIRRANLCRRYAFYLKEAARDEEAYSYYVDMLEFARNENEPYNLYIAQATDVLDKMAINLYGDYKAAYEFKVLNSKARDKMADQQRRNDIAILTVEHDEALELVAQEKETEAYKKRKNIQYFGIGVGLILLFLIFIIVSSLAVPNWLINMLGFFSVLFVFEFVILILDDKIHHWAHGNYVLIFLVKVLILSFLFPLHHVIEKGVSTYMVKHQLIRRPKGGAFRQFLIALYPWMDDDENNQDGHH